MSDRSDHDEGPTLTDADVGKAVIAPTGTPIGTVVDVERGIPVVDVDETVEPSFEGVVGLTSGDGRLAVPLDRILDVSEETVHLQ
jgi:hypothetical protein